MEQGTLKPARERTVTDFSPQDKILFFRAQPEDMRRSTWYTGTVLARGAQSRVECRLDSGNDGFAIACHPALVPASAIELFRDRPEALAAYLLDSFPLEYTMDKEQLGWVKDDIAVMVQTFVETFIEQRRPANVAG